MSAEEWRAIPGYEGIYEVSDLGRVRSLARIDAQGNRRSGKVLSPDVRPSGHLRVTLSLDGRTKRRWVHHLVLTEFVGPRPPDTEACHNDGNPANNTSSNLRWDTKSANALDRVRHGNNHNANKTHCPKGHPYIASNTYQNSSGWRLCRACRLAREKAKRVQARQEEAA